MGNAQQLHQGHDERPVDRQVGPADLVRQPSDEGREGADGVRHDEQVQEVLERHVVVGQHQRRDGPLHVVEVVEHDRGEHHDRQVSHAGPASTGTVGVGAATGRRTTLPWTRLVVGTARSVIGNPLPSGRTDVRDPSRHEGPTAPASSRNGSFGSIVEIFVAHHPGSNVPTSTRYRRPTGHPVRQNAMRSSRSGTVRPGRMVPNVHDHCRRNRRFSHCRRSDGAGRPNRP